MTQSKLRHIVLEVVSGILSENFSKVSDSDFPAEDTTKFVVFNADETYEVKGNTHGLLSHAIKHLAEFSASDVDRVLMQVIHRIDKEQEIYMKDGHAIIMRGDGVKHALNRHIILNTADRINDKFENRDRLERVEADIIGLLKPLGQKYEQLAKAISTGVPRIDQKTPAEIVSMLRSGDRIAFGVQGSHGLATYYLHPKTTGLVITNGSEITTFFKIVKKSDSIKEACKYLLRKPNSTIQSKSVIAAFSSLA